MNWLLLRNSLLVSGLTTLLAAAVGLMAALCLTALPRRERNLALAVAVAALALPPFLVTNCWLHYVGANGAWRAWVPFNLFSLAGTVWILVLLLWPLAMLAAWAAWQKLEASQLEVDPAVTGWALVRWVLLPMARPALGGAALLTFVLALNNFAVPSTLQVKVFPAEVWVQFNTTLNAVATLRSAWPLILGPAMLLLWLWRREWTWPRLQGSVSPDVFRRQLGQRWVLGSGAVTAVLCVLSLGLPLVQLASAKRTWAELPGALEAGQSAVWNSFWFAAATATAVVGVGLCAGALGRSTEGGRREGPHRFPSVSRLLPWTLCLLFFVPGVLLGIGLIAVFNQPPFLAFYRSAGIVILALVLRYLAVGWIAGAQALRATDSDLTDAALLDGATRWQVLRQVQWPQIAPQVAVAWYVVYLLCLWDVESLVLIVPPGGETLALRVFNLLHYGHNTQVNALCLALLGLAVGPLAAWGVARGAWNAMQRRISFVLLPTSTLALLLCGCRPQSPETGAAVQSQLFSKVQIIGTRGVAPGQFNKPRSLTLDRDDNLYVVDMTGRIQKFAPDGRYLLSWQMPQTDLGRPKGMARDAAGNIIVIEPHYQRVSHFTPDGRLMAQWGVNGTNAGQLKMPRAAAVDSRGEILVSEYGEVERVQRFGLEKAQGNSEKPESRARFLGGFGHAGTEAGAFNRPEGLCVDALDRLYVADSCNHRIQVFSSDATFLRAFGKAGTGKGELSYPYDVCVDSEGHVYVCEFGNSRIQVFGENGESLEIIGGPGSAPGRFANPWSMALDSHGDLYVADSQNHRVQKFLRKPAAGKTAQIRNPNSELRRKSELRTPKASRESTASSDFRCRPHKPLRFQLASRRTPHPGPLPSEGRGKAPDDSGKTGGSFAPDAALTSPSPIGWARAGRDDLCRDSEFPLAFRSSDFGFRVSFGFRISDFGSRPALPLPPG